MTASSPQAPFSPRRIFIGGDDHLRPLWRALVFIGLGIVVIRLAAGAVPGGLPAEWALALQGVFACGGLLLETWFLLSVLDQRSFRTVGLWFYSGWGRELLTGVAVGGGLILVVVGLLVLTGGVSYHGLSETGVRWSQLGSIGGVLLFAALFEEVAFRGYGFQRLMDSIGFLWAVVAFSVLFGAAHLANPSVTALSTANTALAGALLAVAYLKTRALWLPLGLHWAWNFFLGPVCSIPVSGLNLGQPVFRVTIEGPVWLSGGNYGAEGSVLLTGVCSAVIVWMWRTKRISTSPAMQEALK